MTFDREKISQGRSSRYNLQKQAMQYPEIYAPLTKVERKLCDIQ
jgi:hypothetical protein